MRPTRLKIDNDRETVPRLVTGYGKTPDRKGEWGLVLRPGEAKGLLLVDNGVMKRWECTKLSDAPKLPDEVLQDGAAALDALAALREGAPTDVGDIALRGEWKAWMDWSTGKPVVKLHRQLGGYLQIRIEADGRGDSWAWRLQRDNSRWYTANRADRSRLMTARTLREAIWAAANESLAFAGEVCAQRDTRRRGAIDKTYTGKRGAAVPSKESGGRDAAGWVARRKAKPPSKPKAAKKAKPTKRSKARPAPAAAGKHNDDGGPTSDTVATVVPVFDAKAVPKTAGRMTAARQAHIAADAQQAADEVVPELKHALRRAAGLSMGSAAEWDTVITTIRGLDTGAADRVETYARQPGVSVAAWWDRTGKALVDQAQLDGANAAELDTGVRRALELLRSAPLVLARVRWLLVKATDLARVPRCRGDERQVLLEALEAASVAYEEARSGVVSGLQSRTELRRVIRPVERLALSVAKAARTCAAGQRDLFSARKETGAKGAKPKPKPSPKPRARSTAAGQSEPARAPSPATPNLAAAADPQCACKATGSGVDESSVVDVVLHGHTSEDTACLVDDYPYGRRARTQARFWLEHNRTRGYRFVKQTLKPKSNRWNRPKKSTYTRSLTVIFKEAKTGHIHAASVSDYDPKRALEFLHRFNGSLSMHQLRDLRDLGSTSAMAQDNAADRYKAGSTGITINGEPVAPMEGDERRAREQADGWRKLATEAMEAMGPLIEQERAKHRASKPPRKRRTSRPPKPATVRSRPATPKKAPKRARAPVVDLDKDKALMGLMGDAFKQVVQELRG